MPPGAPGTANGPEAEGRGSRFRLHDPTPASIGTKKIPGVLTDAGKLRGDSRGGENCLSPDVLRSLVGGASLNCRHNVSDEQLRDAIERSRAWSSAADDFWSHCNHASEASLRRLQYADGRGMSLAFARQHAITDLTRSGGLPGWNADETFDWLIQERERLDK